MDFRADERLESPCMETRAAHRKDRGRTARRFLISGRVQGVGFRAFAQRAAYEIGVTGWARNLEDGRVEVYAAGTAKQLDELEARLRQGPAWSEVRGFHTEDAEVSTSDGFHVR
jgi:acylphosphatase